MPKTLKAYITGALVVAITALMSAGPLQAQINKQTETNEKTVVDVVKSNKDLSKFADLLDKSGFAELLDQPQGEYTVLAPKNEAIKNADPELKQDPKNLVQMQVLRGNIPKDRIESELDVKVEETDNSASNGTVYVVDDIASPPQRQQQR
ncbi:MAG TPA: fasciclin domain-containing protein [Balneolaceae bacterium]|nr:fasciclin domain-containing protein [Balneolaceae bacterium]